MNEQDDFEYWLQTYLVVLHAQGNGDPFKSCEMASMTAWLALRDIRDARDRIGDGEEEPHSD